jgi:hypothetical protein
MGSFNMERRANGRAGYNTWSRWNWRWRCRWRWRWRWMIPLFQLPRAGHEGIAFISQPSVPKAGWLPHRDGLLLWGLWSAFLFS